MKNRKPIKCLLAAFAMVMVLSLTGITANAATKSEKLTLLVGEQYKPVYIGMGTIKSVKSSKSKVANAKKKSGGIQITAKKAGKTNVTVKGSRGNTFIHKITVAKANFVVAPTDFIPDSYGGGDLIVTLTNKTPVGVDWFDIDFIFKNAAGGEVKKSSKTIFYVGKKQKASASIYFTSSEVNQIDLSKTTYQISYRRSAEATYTNYVKKIKFSEKRQDNILYITAKPKKKYKGNGTIYLSYEVTSYDAAGNVIDFSENRGSLSSTRKSDTTPVYLNSNAVRYSIKKRVLLRTY